MKRLFLFFISNLVCIVAFAQNITLSGVIKDTSGEVLPGAGVFVSGYKIATVANNNGAYTLALKPGNYDILFQIIGYKTVAKNILVEDKAIKLDVELEEDAMQLDEVTIKPDPNRAGYIRMFTDFFIGTTPNALQCKIINPNVLIIDYSKDDSKLTVKTNQFLIVENKALGYRIKYQINLFEWDNKTNIIYYEGYPYYEDLKGSKGQMKRWFAKREIAYHGSSSHFLTSLYNGKSKEEGFIINKLVRQADKTRPSDSLINTKVKQFRASALNSDGKLTVSVGGSDSLNYWVKQRNRPKQIAILNQKEVLPDTLVKTFNESIKSINYTDVLYVVYTKEKEDPIYTNRIGLSISRPLTMPDYQISLVNLLVAPVYFYQNGGTYNPRSMLFEGYWSWEKIADSVPLDYQPQKASK